MTVRDLDFHPDESTVRVFKVGRSDVPRLDDACYVSRARYGDAVLHHYAWADNWFKVNVTTDLAGNLIETAVTTESPSFAFNIDIATPMLRSSESIFAVDLFCDVLVKSDARSYVVVDEDELEHAVPSGAISRREYESARRQLDGLVKLIEAGDLLGLLHRSCPLGPSNPDPAQTVERVPVSDVPEVAPHTRRTW